MAEPIDGYLAALMRGGVPAPSGDWRIEDEPANRVMERVRLHGIAGVLAESGRAASGFTAAQFEAVLAEARMQLFWEESHRAALAGLLERLTRDGISVLLLKGTALAYSLYPQAHLRRRGDSDLLVREADLAEVRRQLANLGFAKRTDPVGLFYQEGWLLDTGIGFVHALDLHWRPTDSPVLQEVLRADEFFARAQPLPLLGENALAPWAVHTFVQGGLNQAWHASHGYLVEGESVVAPERLIWVMDNHLLAGSFTQGDWGDLLALAEARGVAPIIRTALASAQRHMGTQVPALVMDALAQAPARTAAVSRLLEQDRVKAALQDLEMLGGLRAKASYLAGHALAPADHLRRKYPRCERWPLAILQLRRWGEIALRWRRAGAEARR